MNEIKPIPEASVEIYLRLFFPMLFEENGSEYVDPEVLAKLIDIAVDARPPCLRSKQQDLAQALFVAYLVSVRNDSWQGGTARRGAVSSEREGDIAISYAKPDGGDSKAPPSSPWDQWYRLWQRCTRGVIVTRYGDPWRSRSQTQIKDGVELSLMLQQSAKVL